MGRILKCNPINKNDQLIINGELELFYLIDFEDIRENAYYITSFGRVISRFTGEELTQFEDDNGFKTVNMRTKINKSKVVLVHKLLSKAFIEKTEEDIEKDRNYIMFLDNDKSNISIFNLKWVTLKELRYSRRKAGNTKVSVEDVHSICKLLEQGYSISECASILSHNKNISKPIIYTIASKRSWVFISDSYDIKYKVRTRGDICNG